MRGNLGRALVLGACITIFLGKLAAEEPVEAMSHGELAKRICFISGLAESMKPPITHSAAISRLTQQGWTPIHGWRVDAYATREDFYVVMAKYMGLRLEGPPDQAQSYYHALATEGLFVDPGRGVSEVLDPAPPRLGDASVEVSRVALMTKGGVECRRKPNDAWTTLQAYDTLVEGMEIRTGAQGEANLAFGLGCAQQISENSLVRIKKLSTGTGPLAAVVEIDHGKTYTMVKPLPEGSSFVVETQWGNLDVDIREGCEFESVVVKSEPLTLNEQEREIALGWAVLAPIQSSSSRHTGFSGRATGHHRAGREEFLKSGQSLLFLADGLRIGRADSFDFGRIAGLIRRFEKFTHDFLLTESEIRAFLANIASGGTCEIHVTPIGR